MFFVWLINLVDVISGRERDILPTTNEQHGSYSGEAILYVHWLNSLARRLCAFASMLLW